MSVKLKLLVEADAKQAKAELAATQKAVKGTTAATDKLGKSGKVSAGGIGVLGGSAKAAETQVERLSAAEREAATTAVAMGRNHKVAAGQMGNLTAQFNDIGVMLAAGQNPLTLALQQGTQITQVIGPMGAAGAVVALKSAFVGMLNPISLITIGSIAAGAALFQWLTGSGEKARTFKDELGDLTDGIALYSKAVDAASAPSNVLADQFGSASVKAQRLLKDMAEIENKKRSSEIGASISSLMEDAGIFANVEGTGNQNRIAELFDLSVWARDSRKQINSVIGGFENLQSSDGIEAQISATEELISSFQQAANKAKGITDKEKAQLSGLKSILLAMYELQAIEGRTVQSEKDKTKHKHDFLAELVREENLAAVIAQYGEDSAQAHNQRLAQEREIYAQKFATVNLSKGEFTGFMDAFDAKNKPRDPMAERIAGMHRFAGATKAASLVQLNSANNILAKLVEENTIRRAIIKYGENSAIVEQLRATAARGVLEQMLEQLDVAESVKEQIRESWQEGQTLNSTQMADGIAAAAAEAKRVADEITRAVGAAQALSAQGSNTFEDAATRLKFAEDPVGLARAMGTKRMQRKQGVLRNGAGPGELADLNAEATAYGETMAQVAAIDQKRLAILKKNRGSGGGRGTKKQVDALAKLIEKEQLQIAILQETDPIQKEMLRNREALAGATDTERQSVEALIASRIKEAKAATLTQTIASSLKSTLDQPIQSFRDLENAAISAIETIAAKARHLLLDPVFDQIAEQIANIFKPSGSGGGFFSKLLGGLFGGSKAAPVAANAEGGMIYGPGSGTSDSILSWVSSGEYIVNAAATGKNRHLLERINAGLDVPGFAAGGYVAPSHFTGSPGTGNFGGGTQIQIINQSSTPISGDIEETVDASGQRRSKLVLADAVGEALTTRGGGARRAMRKTFGLQPVGARR